MIIFFIIFFTIVFIAGTLKKQVEKRIKELELRNQELELANEQLQILSSLDGLTGISNRRHFERLLTQEWRRNLRDRTPISIALMDIDFFKKYNDTYGHQAGDECLRQVASAIATIPNRPGDFTARYGGEEFVVLLTNTQLKGALKIGENIRSVIESLKIPHSTSDVCPYVTVSIGIVSVTPFELDNPYDFVNKADIALYGAKRNGRNKVQVYIESNDKFVINSQLSVRQIV